MALEETYNASPTRLGVPVLAFYGEESGRDKLETRVSRDAAELWLKSTVAAETSRAVPLAGVDWYVLQEPAGTAAVQAEVGRAMAGLVKLSDR